MASPGHWLSRAIGNVSANRAAIGATVAVTAGGATRLRYVNGGTGQGCQDSMYLHVHASVFHEPEALIDDPRTVRELERL